MNSLSWDAACVGLLLELGCCLSWVANSEKFIIVAVKLCSLCMYTCYDLEHKMHVLQITDNLWNETSLWLCHRLSLLPSLN